MKKMLLLCAVLPACVIILLFTSCSKNDTNSTYNKSILIGSWILTVSDSDVIYNGDTTHYHYADLDTSGKTQIWIFNENDTVERYYYISPITGADTVYNDFGRFYIDSSQLNINLVVGGLSSITIPYDIVSLTSNNMVLYREGYVEGKNTDGIQWEMKSTITFIKRRK